MTECLTVEGLRELLDAPHYPMKLYYVLTPVEYDYWKEQWHYSDEDMQSRGFVRDTYIPSHNHSTNIVRTPQRRGQDKR